MNPRVRFEDEAEAEYRAAGRWYEERRVGLGLEFLDAVDTTIDQIVKLPHAGAPLKGSTRFARPIFARQTLPLPRRLPRSGNDDPCSCGRA